MREGSGALPLRAPVFLLLCHATGGGVFLLSLARVLPAWSFSVPLRACMTLGVCVLALRQEHQGTSL